MSPATTSPLRRSTTDSVAALLDGPIDGPIDADEQLWGFGGLHGGLALALLIGGAESAVDGADGELQLRAVTARYHRPIRGRFEIEARPVRRGRSVTTVVAEASDLDGVLVTADAVLGRGRVSVWPSVEPPMPIAPPPEDCDVFTIPPELVPFATRAEVRPVGTDLPFAGGPSPRLTAWIRLVEDDRPPDLRRLAVLLDSLAPSYAAILDTPALVPTVELTVRPAPGLADATSPWVLLSARTLAADATGWVDERIDAWTPDGRHLGAAHQLRLTLALA